MALPNTLSEREHKKFVDDGSGNTAIRAKLMGGTVTGNLAVTGTITTGTAGGTTGTLILKGSTSGTITIRAAVAAGTYTLTLPTNDGDANQVLTTDGSGTLSWTTPSGGAPTDATYITQTANGSLSAEQALSTLATGVMQVTNATGVISSVTTSAGLATLISDETGTGALVFANTPTLVTPEIGAATGTSLVLSGGATINNSAGATGDFNVKGDTDANLLFIDVSADNIGIGTTPTAGTKLHIGAWSGTSRKGLVMGSITGTAGFGGAIEIGDVSGTTDATGISINSLSSSGGAVTGLYFGSLTSGGASDCYGTYVGTLTGSSTAQIYGSYIAGGTNTNGEIYGYYIDNSTAKYCAGLIIGNMTGGANGADGLYIYSVTATDPAMAWAITTNAGLVTFNEGGNANSHFRVESDTDANNIYSDATNNRVGIGTATPSTKLEVSGVISAKAGSAANVAKVGGVMNVNTTAVGNVGVGEDNLITYSLPASTLGTNGDYVEIEAWGTFAGNANAKTVTLYFGATALISSGSANFNGGAWHLCGCVLRTGAATQEAIADATSNNALLVAKSDRTTPAETLSGAITIKCTGTGVDNDDISQKGMIVKWYPNNT